jgi:integration host factor subunit alpha
MSLGKKDIVKNISTKAHISSEQSINLLNAFIKIVKIQSNSRIIKISNFGSFFKKLTPQRLGRNPKTKEEFVISQRFKLTLKPSNNIKKSLN